MSAPIAVIFLLLLSLLLSLESFTLSNRWVARRLTAVNSEQSTMSIVEKWREFAVDTTERGSWHCSGSVSAPTVQVNSQYQAYPITKTATSVLKSVAQPALFEKGTETVIDESICKGLQIEPSLVQFCNEQSWNRKLVAITQELKNAFQRTNITLTFYKMLLYEEGDHFASHKDTLKDKTHIASLLISLPVEGECEGGVLRVSGPGVSSKKTIEWNGRCDDLDASWCSFYTDCQLESTPVGTGKRVVLAYQVYSDAEISVKDEGGPQNQKNNNNHLASINLPIDPDGHQRGSVWFKRSKLIDTILNEVIAIYNKEDHCSCHYYRGPRGSGKTDLLCSIGEELQARSESGDFPCKVYHMLAEELHDKNEGIPLLLELVAYNRKRNMSTVLLLDEVQAVSAEDSMWTKLLRQTFHDWRGLIVIGVGVPSVVSLSFRHAHLPSEIMLQEYEIASLVDVWWEYAKEHNDNITRESLEAICRWVVGYTGGQVYPCMAMLQHY